jgi:hypothetical protein
MVVGVTRVRKHGRAQYLIFTQEMREHTGWAIGDFISVRPVDGKLLLERIPLEQLAKLHPSEARTDDSAT